MKIILFSQFYKPESAAAAFRATDNANFWGNTGNEVTVFTGYPNYPIGRIFEGYTPKLITEEYDGKVRVLRSKLIVKPNISIKNRIKNAITLSFFAITNVLFRQKKIGKNYDVVIGTSGIILMAVVAWFFAFIHRIPFVFEIRDITFKQMMATGKKENSMSVGLMKWLELFLCKRSKLVVVVTKGFKKTLIKYGVPDNKIEVITNGVDSKNLQIARPNFEKGFVISYFGTLGISQNLLDTFPYINQIMNNVLDVKYLLIGDGAQRNKICTFVRNQKLDFIEILPSMNNEELEPYYQKSSFNVVVLRNSKDFQYTIPSKIFQIMGRGQAILFIGPKGEAADIIDKYKVGITLTGDKDENFNKIDSFFNKSNYKELICQMGMNGQKAVCENFDRRMLAELYIEMVKKSLKLSSFDYYESKWEINSQHETRRGNI